MRLPPERRTPTRAAGLRAPSRRWAALGLALGALGAALPGCNEVEDMDLTFLNRSGRVLYLEAGDATGVTVRIEAVVDDRWVRLHPTLEELCLPRCDGVRASECVAPDPERPVVHALRPGSTVTRHLEGQWWYADWDHDCVRAAPMRADLRAGICHDSAAIDDATSQAFPEPTSSGVLGTQAGAHLPSPDCDTFPFNLRQATASTLSVPAVGS